MPAIPLSSKIPLRTSTVWGRFSDVRAIPLVYGRVTLQPVQYDDARLLYCLADHAVMAVPRVTRDDAETPAFRWQNTADPTGHAVAILELGEPLAEGERLAATVLGRFHPLLGTLLDNPADVLWDLLANVAGVPVTRGEVDDFRVDCARAGLAVGGVIDDPAKTLRAQIDELLSGIGAVWSGGMPGWARLWPTSLS